MIKSRAFLIACFAGIAGTVLAAGVAATILSVNATSTDRRLTVTKAGSATGSVMASVGRINCGTICDDLIAAGTPITLTATPDANSQFTGWLGPCTGADSCNFVVTVDTTVAATFAPKSLGMSGLDIDGTASYGALSDGILLLRYLSGFTGQGLIAGAIGPSATRTTAGQVSGYLDDITPSFDIDANGRVDALTDGLLILRYMFGLRGTALIAGAVAMDAKRTSPESIELQIASLIGQQRQTISFTSTAPTDAVANGASYAVMASATSGLAVTFSIDASATTVCSIASSVVSFKSAGTCLINADQAGNASYGAAPRVQQAVTVRPAAGSNSYATNFPSTENPISESGKWINGKTAGVDWNNVQAVPGKAHASVLSGNPNRYNDSIAHLNTAFAANQFAQGSVYRAAGYSPGTSKHEVELLLRFQISANFARGYEVLWGHSGYLAVVRWNGPLGDYTALYEAGDPGIGPPVDGDVLRAEIIGNVIRVYKNGMQVASVSDATYANGQPGIGLWPVDGASIDKFGWKNFQAGGL
ncbi:MAG: hypothetical protein ABI831_28060 [Betaproteobacteria bacterium]